LRLKEYHLVQRLTSDFRRHPGQLNTLFGSDSEIIQLGASDEYAIALSTDGIVEEIRQGLYRDPFLIGWMTVTVNLSDLAAVGARAEGILIQLTLPPDCDDFFLGRLSDGIEAACLASDTFVLGGDVNYAKQFSTSGTALGTVRISQRISRIGCRPGDYIYTTGPAGSGTAFAFGQVFQDSSSVCTYQPQARLKEGQVVRKHASACLDTSDGIIPGLAQLATVNDVGFELSESFSTTLCADALDLAESEELPYWTMIAGPHGDFELLFTVSHDNVAALKKDALSINWEPLLLGSVTSGGLVLEAAPGRLVKTEAWRIANIFTDVDGIPKTYLESLLNFHNDLLKRLV